MEHNQVYSGGTFVTNFQVARMGTIPSGNFNITVSGQKRPFLIKNITEDNVEVEIVPAGQQPQKPIIQDSLFHIILVIVI